MILKVKRLHPDAKLPTYAHEGDAGLDLYCLEKLGIVANHSYSLRTGIAMEIPAGHVGIIKEKSGLAMDGVRLAGGIIDSSYRGEVLVIMSYVYGGLYYFTAGCKIAQLLIIPVQTVEIAECIYDTELSPSTRGEKGFGSSGV